MPPTCTASLVIAFKVYFNRAPLSIFRITLARAGKESVTFELEWEHTLFGKGRSIKGGDGGTGLANSHNRGTNEEQCYRNHVVFKPSRSRRTSLQFNLGIPIELNVSFEGLPPTSHLALPVGLFKWEFGQTYFVNV